MAISPELVGGAALMVDVLPRLRTSPCGRRGPAPERPDAELVAALDASVRPADDLAIVFTSGQPGTPKGVIHTHGGALGATAAGLEVPAASRATTASTSPCRSSGSAASAPASSPPCSRARPCSPRRAPNPPRTLPFLERERVTLFRGWPDQAAALARDPGFASADLSSLRPGSLDAVMPTGSGGRRGGVPACSA